MKRSKDIQELDSKTFQALFEDSEMHITLAEKYHQNHIKSIKEDASKADQESLRMQSIFSRSCILSSIAALEALSNAILHDFKKYDFNDLDSKWLKSRHKKNENILRWQLEDKVFIIPAICRYKIENPNGYFKNNTKILKLLEEMRKIRNSIAHGEIEKLHIKIYDNKTVDFSIKSNFWPLTQIPRDAFGVGFDHAKLIFDHSLEVAKFLIEKVEPKIELEYLNDQIIKYKNGQTISVLRGTNKPRIPKWLSLLGY